MPTKLTTAVRRGLGLASVLAVIAGLSGTPVSAQVTAYKQAVAEAAAGVDAVGEYYRSVNYAALWTGEGAEFRARRAALIDALENVEVHGLPAGRYDVAGLMRQMREAHTTRDIGMVEVALSKAFLRYARDVQSGMLTPIEIDPGLVRKVEYRDGATLLRGLAEGEPRAVFRALPPTSMEYRMLVKERLKLQQTVANGSWGPRVPGGKMEPGDSGAGVVALRNRLIAMGYLERSPSRDYDPAMQRAVMEFQQAHGLETDGVAGDGTIEEINVSPEERLKSVLVAMERERWTNMDRGERHILVNLADFTAKIIDHGEVTFRTRSVIGMNRPDRRSPEFSDTMEHMIVNPSWHVPRSIITKEYLPQLQRNPNSNRHLIITDRYGRQVDRANTDFTQFSARNFPFSMRQAPSNSNALGLVKFMFPNKYNIYLHDTPAKNLFARETRAYSHGCIRLADPFDFAYALLAKQEADPKGYFQRVLKTGRETKIDLVTPLPVHLIYRTALISPKGRAEFRRDVYGRDAKIWEALNRAGVELSAVRG
ncbi:L,D-transpeptidase family protein [Arenibacterium halophilum]|uniref:Murein L,D-transpeptidase n=1 Tax=Arenibacterium halophilum TaxID=2583821 RepID=A0ABY2XB40_9RHOB|nr:L,D-transpeptidase family protein [Arenibacterium halophilum]TMV13588.1 murein L,D-transpeptidase [Arenibacterium halophilum]